MLRVVLTITLLLLLPHQALAGDKIEYSVYAFTQSHTDMLPVYELMKDEWKSVPNKKSSGGYSQMERGIKANWNQYSINIARRCDYHIVTNYSTAMAFYIYKNKIDLTSETDFQLDLIFKQICSDGLRLSHQWELDNVTTEIRLGVWQSYKLRISNLQGLATWQPEQGTNKQVVFGHANLSEMYTHSNLLSRPNNGDWNDKGRGYTLDWLINWKINNNWQVNVEVFDLYNQFEFSKPGYSEGGIDTKTDYINKKGGLSFNPLYSGVETTTQYKHKLPETISIKTEYSNDKSIYVAKINRYGYETFVSVGKNLFNKNLIVMVDFEHATWNVEYLNDSWRLAVTSNKVNIIKTTQLDIYLQWNFGL